MFSDKFGHGFSSFYEDVEQYELTVPEVSECESLAPSCKAISESDAERHRRLVSVSTDAERDGNVTGAPGAAAHDDVLRHRAPAGRHAGPACADRAVRAVGAADGHAVRPVRSVHSAARQLRPAGCLSLV